MAYRDDFALIAMSLFPYSHPAFSNNSISALCREGGGRIFVDATEVVVAEFNPGEFFVIAADVDNDAFFAPRGPFTKESVEVYLRVTAK